MFQRKAARIVLLLALLAPLFALGPTSARAQAPDLNAEVLTYGVDALPERVRDFYVRTVGGGDEQQLTHLGNAWYQNWSPDAQKIAIVTEALQLQVMNPDGSGLTLLAEGVYSNPFWSPDGRFIAYLGGEGWAQTPLPRGDLWIISSKGGTPWKVPGAEGIVSLPAGVAWSPDGTRIAAGFPGHIFDLTDPAAAPQELPGQGKGMWVLGGGWSPDGRRMALTDGNRWGVLDLTSGEFRQVASSRGAVGAAKGGASWAPGPRKVVFSISAANADGQRVFVADIDGQNPKAIWTVPYVANARRGEISSIGPPGVDPAGQQILVRVTRNETIDGKLTFVHETWKLMLDGSENKLFIHFSFNAVWKPKPRFQAADPAFFNLWRLNDNPVATGQVARTWFWGPQPVESLQEPWTDSPGGTRLVEYYDKGRMEIANPDLPTPSKYYVTSGLLVREMTVGQVQTGPATFKLRGPAESVVAGDAADANTPTYASFGVLKAGTEEGGAPNLTGQPVTVALLRDGTEISALENQEPQVVDQRSGAVYAQYVAETGHNIPDVFWNWLKTQPDWVYLMGYPISEPRWVTASVNGQPQSILVQLYERRTLTYNPQNAPEWQVELGNVGLQYRLWRYGR